MGSFHGLRAVRTAFEPIAGRAVLPRGRIDRKPAARQRSPIGFLGSLRFLTDLLTGLEPKPVRTAAFRLLLRTLRSRALKRPKGHGPKRRFMG